MACLLVTWWLLSSVVWLFDGGVWVLLLSVCSDHALGAEGLAATAWLALRFVRAACWVGYLAIIGMMAGTTDAPGPCGLCS
ncbi:hypothetical protein V6N13_114015 [Hibiscus sabdariffa]